MSMNDSERKGESTTLIPQNNDDETCMQSLMVWRTVTYIHTSVITRWMAGDGDGGGGRRRQSKESESPTERCAYRPSA
jgi:hypothetical protein